MNPQIEIDFTLPLQVRQNTKENQEIFDANYERFSKQCKIVYGALLRGERLTTTDALIKYQVGDLRARVRDLINAGIDVKKELKENRFKIYYL